MLGIQAMCTLLIPFILLETIVTKSRLTLLTTQQANKSERSYWAKEEWLYLKKQKTEKMAD